MSIKRKKQKCKYTHLFYISNCRCECTISLSLLSVLAQVLSFVGYASPVGYNSCTFLARKKCIYSIALAAVEQLQSDFSWQQTSSRLRFNRGSNSQEGLMSHEGNDQQKRDSVTSWSVPSLSKMSTLSTTYELDLNSISSIISRFINNPFSFLLLQGREKREEKEEINEKGTLNVSNQESNLCVLSKFHDQNICSLFQEWRKEEKKSNW